MANIAVASPQVANKESGTGWTPTRNDHDGIEELIAHSHYLTLHPTRSSPPGQASCSTADLSRIDLLIFDDFSGTKSMKSLRSNQSRSWRSWKKKRGGDGYTH